MTLSGKITMDIKENLRKATDEEAGRIRSWSVSNCRKLRLTLLPVVLFFVIAYVVLFIAELLYIRSIFISVITIILVIFVVLFFLVLFFVLAPNAIRLTSKGAYKVLSGRIADKRESEHKSDNKSSAVVFEDEKGNRFSVSVKQADYEDITTGPCLLLKWDDPKISGYRIIMTDRD